MPAWFQRGGGSRFAWLALSGFLWNGNWEWLQGPFFRDQSSALNQIVWFRFHCTVGDVLILLVSALAVSGIRRSSRWLVTRDTLSVVLLTLFGVGYTAWSEHVNLAREAWAYSELMPLLPGTSIGLVPLTQWLVLPWVSVWMTSRLAGVGGTSER